MDTILTSFSKFSKNIREKLAGDNRWAEILSDIEQDFRGARNMFFSQCIDSLRKSKYDKALVNTKMKKDVDILIFSFQFSYILKQLSRYMGKNDLHDFSEKLLHKNFRRNAGKCIDIINCYLGLKDSKAQKLLYYFSVDISKFICGYKTQDLPSKFPCLNSYISSGIPKQILARTNVTGISFIIQGQIPLLQEETARIIGNYFEPLEANDEDTVEEIELDLLTNDD